MKELGNREIMARNLRYYIGKSGKSRSELSEIWGFPYTTISGWLSGEKYPRIDRIQIMADYFGIEITELIGEQQKKPNENAGLTNSQIELIKFARSLTEEQAAMMLRVMKSIVEAGE